MLETRLAASWLPFVVLAAPLMSGCIGELMLAKRLADRASSTIYAWEIRSVHESEDQTPESRGYIGLLPADLASYSPGTRNFIPRATPWRGQARLEFVGLTNQEICFERTVNEAVSAHDDANLRRLDQLMKRYRYGLEVHDRASEATLEKRDDLWPPSTGTNLDRFELVRKTWLSDQPLTPVKDRKCPESRSLKCAVLTYRVCGAPPKMPAEPSLMTVAVDPEGTGELSDTKYVLFWELQPSAALTRGH